MILELQDIVNIVNNRPQKALIEEAQKQYALLYMFCTGIGIEEYVQDRPEFMREGAKETLINLMNSLSDVIHRVMAPMDKIYYAKGGMEQYNIPESRQTDFISFLSNIAEGLSLNEWIRQVVQKDYFTDPNGVILIEINSDNLPYPRTISIMDIHEYLPNGRALEYFIIKLSEVEKQEYKSQGMIPETVGVKTPVYRVIDDTTDRIVVFTGRMKADITSEMPNDFGYVPGMIISDIYGYQKKLRESPLSCCVNLMHDLLNDKGLFKWAFWRGAFPKEWMQIFHCPTCHGEKLNDGVQCQECKGTGYIPFLRTADVVQVDWGKDDYSKNIPTPPAGIIQSDIAALQFMSDHNCGIEDWMHYTMWGVKSHNDAKGNKGPSGKAGGSIEVTAYEAQQNEQPRNDKLRLLGQWRCSIIKFAADNCGWYIYRGIYQGCAIIQGTRFLIESPDATIDRYTKLSNLPNPAPMYVLDQMLQELNENQFSGNSLQYRKSELLRQVEPFVHESVSEIWFDLTLPLVSRLMKKYFDEWTSTVSDYDIANVPDEGGAKILRKQLQNYVMGRYISERQMDSILLNAAGDIINIGDQVKVIWGKERSPEHQGKIYTVSGIEGKNFTLSGDGLDGLFGYQAGELYRVKNNLLENGQ